MKKPKHLLLAIVAVAMSLALSFSVACSGSCSSSCSSCGGAKLSSLELDTEDVKTEYYTGETLSTEGLKITAVYSDKKTEELTLETEGVRVDTTEYQRYTVGTYEIKVSYTAGEVTCNASYNVNVSEVTLSVDTSNVKVLYIVGEDEFTSDNLVVKRTVTTTEGSTTTTLTSSEYNLDKGGFSHTKVGDYVITVSASYNYLTINASYIARVIEPRQGLEVTLKTDYQSKSTITLQGTEADVAVADLSQAGDWIQVRQPDKYGVVADNAPILDASKYTVEVYEGQNKIQNADLATLGGGAYTVWVTMNGEDNDGEPFVYYGFQIVYVIDNVKSIELDSSCSTTMVRGLKNTMLESWKFNVAYESGKSVQIAYNASNLKIPSFNPNQAAEGDNPAADYNGEVTATYKEFNAKHELKTVTHKISYTLTGAVISQVISTVSFDDLNKGDYYGADASENMGLIGNLKVDGSLKISFAHTTKDKMTVKENSSATKIPDTDYSYTKYLNTGGASRITRRALKIELEEGYEYSVTVYANGNGSTGRYVSVYQGEKTSDMTEANGATVGSSDLDGTAISANTFENIKKSDGNYLYIGGTASINIFFIVVTATTVS